MTGLPSAAGRLVIIQMNIDHGLNCRLKTYSGIGIHGSWQENRDGESGLILGF